MKGLLQIALFLLLPVLGMAQCPGIPEICNNGIDDDCDGFIDCFDGDCAGTESCDDFYYGQGEPVCTEIPVVNNTFTMVEDWRSAVNVETRGTPIVGDLDGDGFPEVVTHFRDANTVYILDGIDGTVKATINADMSQYSQSPSIADVDGDGFGEIYLVQEDRTLSCFDHEGNPKAGFTPRKIGSASTPDGGSNAGNPSFVDFNGDGTVEVFIGNQIFDAITGTLIAEASDVYNNSNGSVGANSHVFAAAFDILPDNFCTDCSGAELICGNVVYSVNVATHQLTEVSVAPSPAKDGRVALADWNGDDLMDIIVASTCCGTGGAIYIWDPRTQALLTQDAGGNLLAENPINVQPAANTQVGLPSIADFDGDGLLEMAMAGNLEFIVIDNDMTRKWAVPVQDVSNMTTATSFDFEGDGKTEIVYRDETTLYVLDGETGAIKASTQCGSATRTELPIVVDVDADGEAEIVCTCSDHNTAGKGNVRVYESDVDKWMPTRKVWNTHNYVPSFINDDLTVSKQFQNKALIDGQDLYLSQTTLITQNGGNIYPSLPDFVVEIDTVEFSDCDATTGIAKVSICNEDFNALILDFDITYYQGDPAAGGTLLGTKFLGIDSVDIVSSRCMEVEFEVPAGDYDLFVVVNDDGSNAVKIPSVVIPECDSTNNIASTLIEGCECLDTDGDGVCNVDDLDDDNDGILDRNECQNSNFFWSDPPTINGQTATGVINGIDYTYSSSINIESTPSIFSYGTFPTSFNIPNIKVIKNRFESENTLTFSEPIENPVLVFSSIGGGTTVPIQFSDPVEVLFSSGPINIISPTELTGKEGYVVLRMNGTFSSISFDYLADENYVNFCFGADFLTYCDTDGDGTPDYLDDDSDNDGCLDAIEGDGGFQLSAIDNGQLKGGFDPFGVPLVAGSDGQATGTSTDDAQVAAICGTNFIQVDTLYICKGYSVEVQASNITLSEWSSSSDFTLINDSTIMAKATTSSMYYVTNYTKKDNILVNGDFEDPAFGGFKFEHDSNVPGWSTTATDHIMEFWPDGMLGTPAFSGIQFVELNANMAAALYQDVATTPGDLLLWGFAHRGRDGVDNMDFEVGPPGGALENLGTFSDGKAWGQYNGVYQIPAGQTTTRFYFTSTNGVASGNLLDNIEFTTLQASTDSVYVVVYDDPSVSLGKDTLICEDSTYTISADDSFSSFLWSTSAITSSIEVNIAGDYFLTVTDDNGCKASDTVSVNTEDCLSDLILTDTIEICAGDTAIIEAINIPNGEWFSDGDYTKLTDSSVAANPSGDTWYYYGKSGGQSTGQNIIVNGDFESGSTGFTSEYAVDCDGTIDEGRYCVLDNPKVGHSGFQPCGDHTTGNGNMMVINASTSGGVKVWCQSINVLADTDYEFSGWIASVHPSNPAILEFQINGALMGSTLKATSTACAWQQYEATWNSGVNTSTEICLVNQNTAGGGNDFAIDDIEFAPIIVAKESADSVLVVVLNNPIVEIGNDTLICSGDSIEINHDQLGVNSLWSTLETSSNITISVAGEYSLEVENENGCWGYDTMSLSLQALPDFNLQNDTTICIGDTINVIAGINVPNYEWNTGATTSSINVFEQGEYALKVQDALGCSAKDSMKLMIQQLPIVELPDDTTLCVDASLIIDAGNPGHTFDWSTNESTQVISVSDSGFYSVEVSDSIGCLNSDSIKVEVEIILDPYPEKEKWFCEGSSVELFPGDGFDQFAIHWEMDVASSSIEVREAGTYKSIVSGDFCSDTFSIEVAQIDTPDVSILDENGQEYYCFDIETTVLSVIGEDPRGVSFQWGTGATEPTIEVSDSGTYVVTVSNDNCSSNIETHVEEYCLGQLYIPNAFTPNGDGVNDVFLPVSNGHVDNYELHIYDRWGLHIFDTESLEEGWDGTMKNGVVQNDVYVYKISYTVLSEFGSDKIESVVGTVTLLK